ncbi:siderophore biosynthesis protein [Cohnella xylanilytica]|uniref:MupA/Atu3671 family FMN-dependent luciferase-like monooxygenase n=1 Tax=Cohnella xylanilytica TaxID=557555 RepID=UPI001B0B4351|nr:MupA/Atu3671 family FMN-dependent luciferase-like monooxygenase [Cohnella xylanilytica]GIO13156.1 siderophore biosynthesis protein [Cohnella xylanilytica]
MEFSLFFFSSCFDSQDDRSSNSYRLLLDAAKFADERGFRAVWTPERHFNPFGGLFPNPSVVSAALAMITSRIRLRAGSVVSPLHHPIRIAEEWAVVDRLSGGRAEFAFASGWHSDDFVFYPERYEDRSAHMYEQIAQVQALWAGQSRKATNGAGREIEIRTYPRPVQNRLPLWITSNGNAETMKSAARLGASVLTNFIGQDAEELAGKIADYRETLESSGFPRGAGRIAVMLHTFVGDDLERVRRIVKAPFIDYLASSLTLLRKLAPNATPGAAPGGIGLEEALRDPAVARKLLDFAFARYWQSAALLGTPDSCGELVRSLEEIGVDEIACLIDFHDDYETVMGGLEGLLRLKERFDPSPAPAAR